MTLLKKGTNFLKRLTGSSYLLEINNLTKQFNDVIVILDNNHQIDALYNELKSFYKSKKIIKFPDYGLDAYDNTQIDKNNENQLNPLKTQWKLMQINESQWNLHKFNENSFNHFKKSLNIDKPNRTFLFQDILNRGYDLDYISKKTKISKKKLENFFKDNKKKISLK